MDIEKLLGQMTVEEKLCQMTQLNLRAAVYREDTKTWDYSAVNMTEAQYAAIGSGLSYDPNYPLREALSVHLAADRNGIPLIVMLDIVHGYKTAFPIPLAIGATFDTALTEKCFQFTAKEATQDGAMVTFSPMVDLVRDARWGRVMETTSEDPFVNGEFGKAMIRGYHAGGLACCVKHYAAYGAAEGGRDYNTVDMSEYTLREYYLRAYQECLKEAPEMIMTSFNSLNGVPATANRHLMLDILRGEWQFDGVVITDYNAVWEMINHGYKEDTREAGKAALNATVDMEMATTSFFKHGEDLVKSGEVDEKLLDNSVRRILKLKDKLGLFENPYYKLAKMRAQVTDEGRELSRKLAEESFVLLKNDGVLPLEKGEKIAWIGPLADTKEIVGNWCGFCDRDATVTVKSGVENLLGRSVAYVRGCGWGWNDKNESGIAEAVELAKEADKIVLCVGEHQSESGECRSKADIRIPNMQRKLIKAIRACGKPVVGVVFAGRPLALKNELELFDGLLYVWQPGTEGGNAIANVLYGEVCPSGKLPMSFPRSVGQCPIYYNHYATGRPQPVDAGFFSGTTGYQDERNAPLFPFGFGLSYTRFEISEPILSATELREDERLTVQVTVKNVGDTDGAEVVQLYLRDDFSELVRPVKMLKGFQRVFLKSGEEREITFTLDKETLSYYGENGALTVEKGAFTVYVGQDSKNVKEGKFRLI